MPSQHDGFNHAEQRNNSLYAAAVANIHIGVGRHFYLQAYIDVDNTYKASSNMAVTHISSTSCWARHYGGERLHLLFPRVSNQAFGVVT